MLRRDTTLPKRIIITPYPPEPHPTLNSIWPLINFHPVLLLLHSSRLYFSHFLSRPFPPLSTLIFDTSSQQQHHQSSPVLSCFLEPNLIDWPVLWQTGVVLFWFTLSFHLPLLRRLSLSHTQFVTYKASSRRPVTNSTNVVSLHQTLMLFLTWTRCPPPDPTPRCGAVLHPPTGQAPRRPTSNCGL